MVRKSFVKGAVFGSLATVLVIAVMWLSYASTRDAAAITSAAAVIACIVAAVAICLGGDQK